MSKLQNEHNIFFRVVLSHGVIFEKAQYHLPNDPYEMQGHEHRVREPISTIFYNQPFRLFEQLKISPAELIKHKSEFSIWFYFGGESSPLLLTYYKIKIDFKNPNPKNLNKLFIDIDENRYSFEHSDEIGKTEEERINEILERD